MRAESEETRGKGRWSASKKAGVVLRLLRGEDLETVSREVGVAVHELVRWREAFIEGGKESLKGRPASPVERELRTAQRKIGELTMELEIHRKGGELLGRQRGCGRWVRPIPCG